tara:strand:+ start:69 stop:434 length:366 start_codon:yes stop_codon:yes gene_type:complete
MKKLYLVCLFSLIFISNSYAKSITFICTWEFDVSGSLKIPTLTNLYEIKNGRVFEDNVEIIHTNFKLTSKNIEYNYSKLNNFDNLYTYHFKLNIRTGNAFENYVNQDNTVNKTNVATCEFI